MGGRGFEYPSNAVESRPIMKGSGLVKSTLTRLPQRTQFKHEVQLQSFGEEVSDCSLAVSICSELEVVFVSQQPSSPSAAESTKNEAKNKQKRRCIIPAKLALLGPPTKCHVAWKRSATTPNQPFITKYFAPSLDLAFHFNRSKIFVICSISFFCPLMISSHNVLISASVKLAFSHIKIAPEWCGIIERRNCLSPMKV